MARAENSSASIFIDGGPTFEEGANVTIRCYLTGLNVAFGPTPHFIINGVRYNSSIVETNLTEYVRAYSPGFDTPEANYTLTLPNASASYNGTTYQCIGIDDINKEERLHPSGVVTLIITGKQQGCSLTVVLWRIGSGIEC